MGNTGLASQSAFADKYTSGQVEAVLHAIGVKIASETYSAFACYCPFHGNTDTHSFAVNATSGLYYCFNAACGASGTLTALVRKLTGRNEFEAYRFIAKKGGDAESAEQRTHELLTKPSEEWEAFPQDALDRLKEAFPGSPGEAYMHKRGFNDDTLNYFDIGYSSAKRMVAVPVHNPKGLPIGLVGRSIEGKDFHNSRKLARNRTLYNIHRAKRYGDIVIVCEASFDAMKIHQAGFPNVVAILGGSLSPENLGLLDRHFTNIIIMTDFDELQFPKPGQECHKKQCRKAGECSGHNPGRDTGYKIVDALKTKNFLWASYDYKQVYPHGAKDADDLTHDEIAQCIKNAVPHLEYSTWNIY